MSAVFNKPASFRAPAIVALQEVIDILKGQDKGKNSSWADPNVAWKETSSKMDALLKSGQMMQHQWKRLNDEMQTLKPLSEVIDFEVNKNYRCSAVMKMREKNKEVGFFIEKALHHPEFLEDGRVQLHPEVQADGGVVLHLKVLSGQISAPAHQLLQMNPLVLLTTKVIPALDAPSQNAFLYSSKPSKRAVVASKEAIMASLKSAQEISTSFAELLKYEKMDADIFALACQKVTSLTKHGSKGLNTIQFMWLLMRCPNLRHLEVEELRSLSAIAHDCPNLQSLTIGKDSWFNETVISVIGQLASKCKHLTHIALSQLIRNHVTKDGRYLLFPGMIRAIADKFPHLKRFEISKCGSGNADEVVYLVNTCKELTHLTWDYDYVSDEIVKGLVCPQLKSISLRGNVYLSIEGVQSLVKNCPLLETADLRDCYFIEETALQWLKQKYPALQIQCGEIHYENFDDLFFVCPRIPHLHYDERAIQLNEIFEARKAAAAKPAEG